MSNEERECLERWRQGDLDELVQDMKAQEADGINELGEEAQLIYLLVSSFQIDEEDARYLVRLEE